MVAQAVRAVTVGDWITVIVALAALVLSIYNTYIQRRDRIPRVEMERSSRPLAAATAISQRKNSWPKS